MVSLSRDESPSFQIYTILHTYKLRGASKLWGSGGWISRIIPTKHGLPKHQHENFMGGQGPGCREVTLSHQEKDPRWEWRKQPTPSARGAVQGGRGAV